LYSAGAKLIIPRINQKAKLLDPQEFATIKCDRKFRLSLSPKFAEALGLEVRERHKLEMYFSKRQIDVIKFLSEHPHSMRSEIGRVVKMDVRNVSGEMSKIEHICRRHHLPRAFEEIGKASGRCSLTTKFMGKFCLQPASFEPVSLLTPAQRPVYRFFKRRPNATTACASRKLGIKSDVVAHYVKLINATLSAHGFPPISYKRKGDTFKSLHAVADYLCVIDERREFGLRQLPIVRDRKAPSLDQISGDLEACLKLDRAFG